MLTSAIGKSLVVSHEVDGEVIGYENRRRQVDCVEGRDRKGWERYRIRKRSLSTILKVSLHRNRNHSPQKLFGERDEFRGLALIGKLGLLAAGQAPQLDPKQAT